MMRILAASPSHPLIGGRPPPAPSVGTTRTTLGRRRRWMAAVLVVATVAGACSGSNMTPRVPTAAAFAWTTPLRTTNAAPCASRSSSSSSSSPLSESTFHAPSEPFLQRRKRRSYGFSNNPRASTIATPTFTYYAGARRSGLHAKSDSGDVSSSEEAMEVDASTRLVLGDVKRALKRASWLSWWSQVILTTVSSIILIFARNVLLQQQSAASLTAPKLFLSTSGLVVSVLSIIWTWGNGQRLSRRIVKPQTSLIKAAMLLRRAIKVGCMLNLVGLLLHLLAAEQIVGALAIKVLTLPRSPASPYLMGAGTAAMLEGALQPLDILIVQANTNSLLSHFCSLVLLLWLVDPLHKLDPPSAPDGERKGGN